MLETGLTITLGILKLLMIKFPHPLTVKFLGLKGITQINPTTQKRGFPYIVNPTTKTDYRKSETSLYRSL